jgi:hypothetical protein
MADTCDAGGKWVVNGIYFAPVESELNEYNNDKHKAFKNTAPPACNKERASGSRREELRT